jgi:hypothetical protein
MGVPAIGLRARSMNFSVRPNSWTALCTRSSGDSSMMLGSRPTTACRPIVSDRAEPSAIAGFRCGPSSAAPAPCSGPSDPSASRGSRLRSDPRFRGCRLQRHRCASRTRARKRRQTLHELGFVVRRASERPLRDTGPSGVQIGDASSGGWQRGAGVDDGARTAVRWARFAEATMIIRLPNGMRRGRRSSSGRGRPRSLKPSTVFIGARRTSVRLEPAMWEALADIAEEQGRTMHHILTAR